jgi:hypothetical protein
VAKTCAFCNNDAVERGGEHIWDDWLNKALPKTTYRARRQNSLDTPAVEFDTDSLNEKLPVVCRECNNGWMSDLSGRTKDVFSRTMLHGEPFSLGAKDAALLAAFTFMKNVVTNHTIDDEPFFTRAARNEFRTSLVLPPLVKIWFACYVGVYRMSTINNLAIISANSPGPLYGQDFCSHTYAVGKLALQLLAVRWKDIKDRGKPLVSLTPNDYWSDAATLVWPYQGNMLSWPPPKVIGDDVIQAFIGRFRTKVEIPMRQPA